MEGAEVSYSNRLESLFCFVCLNLGIADLVIAPVIFVAWPDTVEPLPFHLSRWDLAWEAMDS
jgi:hypothetical protein